MKYIRIILIIGGLATMSLVFEPVRSGIDLLNRAIPKWNRYGDLYSMTNIERFKEVNFHQNRVIPEVHYSPTEILKNKDLYLMGDSFIEPIHTNQYISEKTEFIRIGISSKQVTLNKNHTNVLVIENVERAICTRLGDSDYQELFMGKSGYYAQGKKQKDGLMNEPNASVFKEFGVNNVENTLQNTLFNFRIILPLKQLKAAINEKIFGRINSNNIISKNGKHIFYHDEASLQKTDNSSSYCPINKNRLNSYIHNAEEITHHYKKMGFDEIYFIFIPNKASICAPNDHPYNHQIELLNEAKNENFKIINIYKDLKGHPELYHIGDGHWNSKGMILFKDKINKLLSKGV